MKENSKRIGALILAMLVAGVVIVVLLWQVIGNGKENEQSGGEEVKLDSNKESEETKYTTEGFIEITESEKMADKSNKSYGELVEEYEGRRIQFENCRAIPTSVTYKNGTTILLDGKSPDPQRIMVNGQAIVLSGYDTAIITLRSDELPQTLQVDCEWIQGTQYNTAQILLQQ